MAPWLRVSRYRDTSLDSVASCEQIETPHCDSVVVCEQIEIPHCDSVAAYEQIEIPHCGSVVACEQTQRYLTVTLWSRA